MKIEKFVLGPLATNTYLLTQDNKAILIDPASKGDKLINILKDYELKAVLLTHGHFDHIKAVDELYNKYHCPTYLNELDLSLANDKYSGIDFGLVSYISTPTVNLKEGEYHLGPFCFKVIFTPGHTQGSVIYAFNDALFTGDTLFKGSVGRTDLKGGSATALKQSLNVFKKFNKDYTIYPGHDEITSLYYELENNPYL